MKYGINNSWIEKLRKRRIFATNFMAYDEDTAKFVCEALEKCDGENVRIICETRKKEGLGSLV